MIAILVNFLRTQSRAISLIFVLIAAAGALALLSLPSGLYPELVFPRIVIIADLGFASPERAVLNATRPLEEAASQVWGVRWIRSKTIRGSAELSIEFLPGTDMSYALQQLQSRINEVQGVLPPNTVLTIERVTPSIVPVLSYSITSDKLTQADLYTIARYQIQPQLTRVKGVSRVQVLGGDFPQVTVEVDQEKLKSNHLSIAQVTDTLRRTNQIQVVGRMTERYQQNLVVATGEALRVEDLGGLVITTRGVTTPVYLRDIAKVYQGYADRTRFVSVDGKRGLVVNVFRQPTASVVTVSDGVRKEISALRESLPPGVKIAPGYDESELVKQSMANVRDAIVTGIVLIVVILFAFLHDWRSTIIAAITIPVSALAAFAVLWLMHGSLNLMSLGGLAVAIGLVIDDAIVVIENIDRQVRAGTADPIATALGELIGPVTSSTATTLVVFLPLGLLSGVPGQFFASLTVTLAAAVMVSWVLALTLTPVLSASMLRARSSTHGGPGGVNSKLDVAYGRVLRAVLARPTVIAVSSIVLLLTGVLMFSQLGTDFLPRVDEGSFVLDYLSPPGTAVEETERLAHGLDTIMARTPEVISCTRRTGAEMGLFATEPNKGDTLAVLQPSTQRHRSIFDIMDEQRKIVAHTLPQLDVEFHQVLQDQINDLSGADSPINIRIFGENPEILHQIANAVEKEVTGIPGLVDVVNTAKNAAPELDVRVDPRASGRLGLAPADVAAQIQNLMLGDVATQLRQGDRLVDVRVRFPDTVRFDARQFGQLPIINAVGGGNMLPLSAVATVSKAQGERLIYRENQQRYAAIKGELESRDLGSVVHDIQARLAHMKLPAGYRLSIAGLYASQQEAFQQLLLVLMLASVLVYALLVIQFKSWLQPLAIFSAIPLALFGVIFALWSTHTALNVSSFMGVILLIGLVVKNGIILLEYTNRLRADGASLDEALVQAGSIRLRPILMTTLCTILGLAPLAIGFGAGAELQKSLAIAVIGGLSLSTVFTLLFVPVIYRILEHLFAPSRSRQVSSEIRKPKVGLHN